MLGGWGGGKILVNSTFFGKNSVASAHLKLFSELNWFLELEFVKLEFQPKIEFEKLDLCLTLIKKKKKKVELKFSKLKFHAFKKNNPNGTRVLETQILLFFLNETRVY